MTNNDPRIRHITVCESTNDLAHELDADSVPSAILADTQTNVRGRLGHRRDDLLHPLHQIHQTH